MTIRPEQLSPELQAKVVVNGTVNLEKLQEITASKNQRLAIEAGKLLQAGLSGSGSTTQIGDAYESTTQNGVVKYVSDWWSDKDKVSTDGEDDGKISNGEKVESLAKGFVGGIAKNVAKNPVESAVAIGGTAVAAYGTTAALSALGVAAAGPIVAAGLVLTGIGFGAKAIYDGLKGAKEADSDGAAKAGYEEAGTGASAVALSVLGARKIGKSKTTATETTAAEAKVAQSTATETAATELKPVNTKKTIKTISELQNNEVLNKAGFTEEVLAELKNTKLPYGEGQLKNTLEMVKFLEKEIANGEKITPKLIRKAMKECDGCYGESGYYEYQETQLRILNKYWSRAEEARAAYRKEGKFFTEHEKIATEAARQREVLTKAGFTDDVLTELKNTKFTFGKEQQTSTIKTIEYLEGQIANGEKITKSLIDEALKECGKPYEIPDYQYNDEILGILAKYWTHGEELLKVYK